MTTPGEEGNETVACPNCGRCVEGDDTFCPFCDYPLWDVVGGGVEEGRELSFD